MDCWDSRGLTFDLEGRRSSRPGRGFKRFCVVVRRRFDFLATLLATSAMAGVPTLLGPRSSTSRSLRRVGVGARLAPNAWLGCVVGDELAGRARGGVEGALSRVARRTSCHRFARFSKQRSHVRGTRPGSANGLLTSARPERLNADGPAGDPRRSNAGGCLPAARLADAELGARPGPGSRPPCRPGTWSSRRSCGSPVPDGVHRQDRRSRTSSLMR
jgi:hypothetical protein